jgi:hypothetical protein
MMRNPWKHGDIAESLAKLQKLGGGKSEAIDMLQGVLDVLEQIEESVSAVEREDERRAAAREAARKFFGRDS